MHACPGREAPSEGVNFLSMIVHMQEEGSGCEMQSSCTAAAPAAKRIKAQGPEVLPLRSMGSFESSALTSVRSQPDVVEDSEKLQCSVAAERKAADAERAASWSKASPMCEAA